MANKKHSYSLRNQRPRVAAAHFGLGTSQLKKEKKKHSYSLRNQRPRVATFGLGITGKKTFKATCLNGGEHKQIGKAIDLHNKMHPWKELKESPVTKAMRLFDGGDHRKTAKNVCSQEEKLTLPNGVEITFGDIIALAGDHYGIPEQPVIDPSIWETDEVDPGRPKRFLDAYNTLARTPKDKIQDELKKLFAALDIEIKTGKSVSDYEWDKITGGKWLLSRIPIQHGRMLKLAEHNHDHFLPYAKEAYLTGHQLAMDKAREARKTSKSRSKRIFHEALSLDAFSCHFLTDSFSSGHIRVPRVELGKATTIKKNGHLLCKYMHDEDGKYGLRVKNARGDKWIAYGDGMLLEEKSKDNWNLVVEAVNKSVDQVFEAYKYPTKLLDTEVVTDLIPFVDPEEKNNFPMFQVKDGEIHKRADINDLQDPKTVTNWWGLTTAVRAFVNYKPKNSAI